MFFFVNTFSRFCRFSNFLTILLVPLGSDRSSGLGELGSSSCFFVVIVSVDFMLVFLLIFVDFVGFRGIVTIFVVSFVLWARYLRLGVSLLAGTGRHVSISTFFFLFLCFSRCRVGVEGGGGGGVGGGYR